MSEGVWERSMTGAMEQSKGRRAMEHRIIFATSNQGKMREIREILKGLGTEIPVSYTHLTLPTNSRV